MHKRVIFIGGSSFSGSTLLGCILGSNPQSPFNTFHLGEVHAFFNPQHPKYGKPFGALQTGGIIWKDIDCSVGPENAYYEIFKKSKSNIIIDSSKNINWLKIQHDCCKHHDWSFQLLVSYRTFAGIWDSGKRRNLEYKRNLSNIMYYPRLLSEIQRMGINFSVINISFLINSPAEITQKICTSVNLPYFNGKENYWNFNHYHLYGSSTQRKQMKDPKNASFYKSSYKKNIFQQLPLNSNQIRLLEEAKFSLENKMIT
jgi:hypothetical protein